VSWREQKSSAQDPTLPWYVRKVVSLWPRHWWNDDLKKAWAKAFESHKSTREPLETAIQLCREEQTWERIEIGHVKKMLKRLRDNRNGTRQSAEDRAKERREEREVEYEQAVAQHQLRLLDLEAMDPADLKALIESTQESFPFLRTDGNLRDLSRLSVGMIHANGFELGFLSMLRPELSPDPEPSSEMERFVSTDPIRPASSDLPWGEPSGTPETETPVPSAASAESWFASI
jgi:hypothetical protein